MYQFFNFLVLTGQIKENIGLGLAYPKIGKTVPQFLTIKEFNRIIEFFMRNVQSTNGLRNLLLIRVIGLLGLRTGTVTALDAEHIDTEAGDNSDLLCALIYGTVKRTCSHRRLKWILLHTPQLEVTLQKQ